MFLSSRSMFTVPADMASQSMLHPLLYELAQHAHCPTGLTLVNAQHCRMKWVRSPECAGLCYLGLDLGSKRKPIQSSLHLIAQFLMDFEPVVSLRYHLPSMEFIASTDGIVMPSYSYLPDIEFILEYQETVSVCRRAWPSPALEDYRPFEGGRHLCKTHKPRKPARRAKPKYWLFNAARQGCYKCVRFCVRNHHIDKHIESDNHPWTAVDFATDAHQWDMADYILSLCNPNPFA